MTYFVNIISRFVIIHVIILIFHTISINASSQCNQGLKLYSIESGEAVCAPIAPYQCIHACEWNTSCAHTTHFYAFRGRRTFLSGLIITDSTFLVQCCASLSTIVEMAANREPVCVWTPEIDTVNTRGSVRLDPPLDKNEYIRDAVLDRLDGQGRVLIRLQVCKFVQQRPHCDKEDLPVEDRHLYSLLLLRLSRIQLLLNGTQNSDSETTKAETQEDVAPLAPRRAAFSVPSAILPYYPSQSKSPDKIPFSNMSSMLELNSGVIFKKKIRPRTRTATRSLENAFSEEMKKVIYTASKSIKSIDLRSEASEIPKVGAPRKPVLYSTNEVLTTIKRPGQLNSSQMAQTPVKSKLQIRKLHHQPQVEVVEKVSTTKHYRKTTTHALPTTIYTLPPISTSTINPYAQSENLFLIQKQAALQGLLTCCQQVPGCGHLCKQSITKAEIESALYSRTCPPISMATMLKCFHQYFDIRPVRECCDLPNRSILSPIKLPPQCLSLCSPDFRISWEHLSCINYVPIIYECYHDLIE